MAQRNIHITTEMYAQMWEQILEQMAYGEDGRQDFNISLEFDDPERAGGFIQVEADLSMWVLYKRACEAEGTYYIIDDLQSVWFGLSAYAEDEQGESQECEHDGTFRAMEEIIKHYEGYAA